MTEFLVQRQFMISQNNIIDGSDLLVRHGPGTASVSAELLDKVAGFSLAALYPMSEPSPHLLKNYASRLSCGST
jgi:hypothetical protein